MLPRLVLMVVLAALLGACGAQPRAAESNMNAGATASAAGSTVAETLAFPVTIQHEDGETAITKPVTRIVTLSEEMMEWPFC